MNSALTPADRTRVRELLGREPQGDYAIVVRDADGDPVVLRNSPFLDDGTPMPTRFWLIGPAEVRRIGQLEADGGVDEAEAAVDPGVLAAAHARYAAERDAEIPDDHAGPRPSGGVGGTRVGVKCLHAHWAWHLAGGDDPIGRWIADRLSADTVTNRTVTSRAVTSRAVTNYAVRDDDTIVGLADGSLARLPWGAGNLTTRWLADTDPPRPAALTNALGAVDDELDDLEREHPTVASDRASFSGASIAALANVEVGGEASNDVELTREAAEEIFRIVATESSGDRAHNPGLPFEHVDTIVAACCIVLAVMRRFHLDAVVLHPLAGSIDSGRVGNEVGR